jgi:hypothetical protein
MIEPTIDFLFFSSPEPSGVGGDRRTLDSGGLTDPDATAASILLLSKQAPPNIIPASR